MKFKTSTGEILTAQQVKRKFHRRTILKDGQRSIAVTFFPSDVRRWDDVLLKDLGLERVE